MIEKYYKTPLELEKIKRLPLPKPYREFEEWKKEILFGRYTIGFVMGIVIDKTNPKMSRVYFDAGRRRKTAQNERGIVLEGIEIKTSSLIQLDIKVGDLVQTHRFLGGLRKITSVEDLEARGILFCHTNFDWEYVIGVII